MVITCMQKRVNIKSNSFNQEHMVITCMQKKVRIKSNSIQNAREITCMQKRIQLNAGSHGGGGKGKGWKLGLHPASF